MLPSAGPTLNERIAQHLQVFGKTARYRELEYLWAAYWGIHYDLDDLQGQTLLEWDQDTDGQGGAVPLSKRKPLLRLGYGSVLVNRAKHMLLGKGQLPTLAVKDDKGKTIEAATEALMDLIEGIGFWGLWEEAGLPTLAMGTGVVDVYATQIPGRLAGTAYLAYHCEPVFGKDDREAAAKFEIHDDDLVELHVQSLKATEDSIGRRKWWLYRRTHLPDMTIVYEDVDVTDWHLDQELPTEEAERLEHGLGFIPAVWVRTMRVVGEYDGVSLLYGADTICDGIDRMQSQRYRACTYHGDPAMAPDDADGAQAVVAFQAAQAADQGALGGGGQLEVGAKRMLPFPAKLLEMSGSGQERQAELVRDLKAAAQERTGIYVHDPEKIKGTLAASALEQLYQPTVALIQALREPFGRGITQLAKHLLRLAQSKGGAAVPGLPTDPVAWKVVAQWPRVIAPTTQDTVEQVTAATSAAELLSQRTRTNYVAPAFGVEDPDAEIELVEKEREARMEQFMATAAPGDDKPPNDKDDKDDDKDDKDDKDEE